MFGKIVFFFIGHDDKPMTVHYTNRYELDNFLASFESRNDISHYTITGYADAKMPLFDKLFEVEA